MRILDNLSSVAQYKDARKMNRTILHVDDDDAIRKLVAGHLKADGFRVLSAPDAGAALKLAHAEQPDLIIADIMMPDESGYSFCRKVKADPQTQDIPVIFLTVMEDEAQAIEAGGVAVIAKPFKHEELKSAVAAYLPKEPRRRAKSPATEAAPVLAGRAVHAPPPPEPDDAQDEAQGPAADAMQTLLDRSVQALKNDALDLAMMGFQEVMESAPGTVLATWARYYAAQIRQHEGDAERAIAEYRAILIDAPGFWRAHNRLAATFAQAGAVGKALQHCRRSLTLNADQDDMKQRLEQLLAWEGPRKVPARKTVLVVEADEAIRRLLTDGAKGAGHRALAASNARQGLRMAFATFPDLIALDAMLGTESGYAMCQKVREEPATQDTPVLMFNVAAKDAAGKVGATAAVGRPLDPAKVIAEMVALVAQFDTAKKEPRNPFK
jgi:DNA-binding response OmpR family regulator